jgi:hypothetical protein
MLTQILMELNSSTMMALVGKMPRVTLTKAVILLNGEF